MHSFGKALGKAPPPTLPVAAVAVAAAAASAATAFTVSKSGRAAGAARHQALGQSLVRSAGESADSLRVQGSATSESQNLALGAACCALVVSGAASRRRRNGGGSGATTRLRLAPVALAGHSAPQQQRPGTQQGEGAGKPRGDIKCNAAVDMAAMEQIATQLCLATSHDLGLTELQASNAVEAAVQALRQFPQEMLELMGPPAPANAFDMSGAVGNAQSAVVNFFYNPRMQYDANGNILLDPQGNPLPDNAWTQFVAVQATLIQRLNEGIHGLGVQQSFGWAVALYTLLIRTALYPFVKTQLETTAKMQVLNPRVAELRKQYADDEEKLQQEVGLMYMDLQIDPLGAIVPLLLQLPVFWGLYRAVRRLAIVEYPPLKEPWLWIPSLFGPNFKPDPDFGWFINWQGPLIELHPKIGWENFALYSILPIGVFFAYKEILGEATKDEKSPAILKVFPFFLAFICVELPQAMGIYIATNIASSVALTTYTRKQIESRIPGYAEFAETGKWPPGVDPERVLAKAFGVQRLTGDGMDMEDPYTVPECVFAGRADFIPELLKKGRSIDEFDDKGIPASAYTLALDNEPLLIRLFEQGAKPSIVDKRGNTLLHYMAGYGRKGFWPLLKEKGVGEMLNVANEDGQTPLDVARVNLSSTSIADQVREVLGVLKDAGATGKQTVEEDEAKFEKMREQRIKEKSLKAARSALMALASSTEQKPEEAAVSQEEEAPVQEAHEEQKGPDAIAASLERVKALDIESLKERLGGKLSETQMERLTERLQAMTPEQLAAYVGGGAAAAEAVAKAAQEEPAAEKAKEPVRQTSPLVD